MVYTEIDISGGCTPEQALIYDKMVKNVTGLTTEDCIKKMIRDRRNLRLMVAEVNIVDVIKDRLELKRQGNSFLGLCPFHTEQTPSFAVRYDKQDYICFSCGEKGDAFDFIEAYHKLYDWREEAVSMLMSYIPDDDDPDDDDPDPAEDLPVAA